MVKNPVLGLFEGTECGDLKQIDTHGAFKMLQKQIVTHGAFKMQKKRPSREAMINCLYMCMLTVTFEGTCFSFAWIHASGSLRPHCSKLSLPQPQAAACHFACFRIRIND